MPGGGGEGVLEVVLPGAVPKVDEPEAPEPETRTIPITVPKKATPKSEAA